MFIKEVAMFLRVKKSLSRSYLQIVESYRENGRVRQRVIGTIGRMEELAARGQVDQLLRSLAKYSQRAILLLSGASDPQAQIKKVGPDLIFARLWERVGIADDIRELIQDRRYRFKIEQAIFVTVLNRLMNPGSDRQAQRWQKGYRIKGAEGFQLQHFYRAMAWLGEPVKNAASEGFSPRCMKDLLEEKIFQRRRDLFTGLDLVFFDTTSLYFEGDGGQTMGRYGYSKDKRPDLKQMIAGVVLDNTGYPLCCELWPGNTSDVKSLKVVAGRLKKRFGIERMCVVADRGMISKKTIEELEGEKIHYILGVRMRRNAKVAPELLDDGGYEEIHGSRKNRKDPSPLKVKEIILKGQRYIICVNQEEVLADREVREQILASLRERFKQGDNALVGNKGYRRYLSVMGASHFVINEKKVSDDARYDGKWVLTTDTNLSAQEVALKYKQLFMVERIFRDMKSVLETRPIFHRCDETIRGHVFCSFLALILRKELDQALDQAGERFEWEDIKRDLKALQEMTITDQGKVITVRSRAQGCCGKVFQAVGVALPASIRTP